MTRARRHGALWGFLVAVCLLVWAAPASAHAFLVSAQPAAGSVLVQSPREVVLHYTQAPDAALSQFAVYDAARDQVSGAAVVQGSTVTVPVRELPPGSYTLRWRVVSADDGHTTSGSFTFAVWRGGPLPSVAGQAAQSSAGVQGGAWGSAARALAFVALFALVGAVFVRLALRREVHPAPALSIGLAVLLTEVWSFGLEGALATGVGFRRFLTPEYLAAGWTAPFGRLAALQAGAGVLAAVALCLPGAAGRVLAGAAALVTVGAFARASHAASSAHPLLGLIVDGAHLGAAAAWGGGLGWVLASGPDLPALVPAFSRWAIGLMAAVLATGVLTSLFSVHAWTALLHSLYGYLLDAKVALVVLVLVAARFSLAAVCARRPAEARRPMAWEAVGAVAVLGVVGVLVGAPPAVVAPASSSFVRQTAVVGGRRVELTVAPARVGANTVTVRLTGPQGQPVTGAGVRLLVRDLDMDMGSTALPLDERGAGAYAATTGVFSMAGTWGVTALGAGWRADFTVAVAPPGGASACASGFDPDLRATAYPLGGGANVLAVAPGNPDAVLAGTESGFALTSDGGRTWRPVAVTRGQPAAAAAMAAGTGPWYAAAADRLWASTDQGATWEARPIPGSPIFALLADPWHPGGLWAATGAGVSYSPDAGQHWRLRGADPPARAISSLAADPWTPGRLYAGGLDGILVSPDDGAHWQVAAPEARSAFGFSFPPQRPGTVWAGAMDRGLWVSRDGGRTWQRSDAGVANPGGMGIATWGSGETVLAGTMGGGLVRSGDYGASWHTAGCPAATILQVAEASAPGGGPVIWLGDQQGAVKIEPVGAP